MYKSLFVIATKGLEGFILLQNTSFSLTKLKVIFKHFNLGLFNEISIV